MSLQGGGVAPRVAVISLGCAKNVADTDLLAGQLLREGLRITPEIDAADAVVVNTCAFLTAAQQESIEAILAIAQHKRTRPECRLIVAGCLSQRHGAALIQEIPEIDLVVGPGEIHSLASHLADLIARGPDGDPRTRLGGLDRVEEDWEIRVVSGSRHSAYVKISDGCDRACSFCLIPVLRGRNRSRRRESIVREVRHLAAGGVREVNLVAQESTAYGTDLYGRSCLAELLRELDSIQGLRWIRLLYAHPSSWNDALYACFRDLGHLCRYVDLPIQHVSAPMLRRMHRPGARSTRKLLDRLREEIPGVAVRTTLMAGFPGETDAEFDEMLSFVREYEFDQLGVFAFSPEEGTEAAILPGQVPAAVRAERRRRLLETQREISRARNRRSLGKQLTLLVDEPDRRGGWIARHEKQAPEVDGITRLEGTPSLALEPGSFIEGIVTSAGTYDLEARPAMGQEVV